MKPSFSQRQGLKPIQSVVQVGAMDDALRNRLWNVITQVYWDLVDQPNETYYVSITNLKPLWKLLRSIWCDYFGSPLDTVPDSWLDAYQHIRMHFFSWPWNEVYDFIEFLASDPMGTPPIVSGPDRWARNVIFTFACNEALERERSGYRFIEGVLTPISSETEITALEEALRASQPLRAVHVHLHQALTLFANRDEPDYRNAIKEAISAVEALCAKIASTPKATLGSALKSIEKQVAIHKALQNAFSHLYGYTSDAEGIRHALLDEPQLDQEDAKFMLVACSGFINYLVAKAAKAGIALK